MAETYSTDLFDYRSQYNYLTGGDGAKVYNWNLINSAKASSINANITNTGILTIAMNTSNSGVTIPNIPYLYQSITGNFDVYFNFADNRAHTYECPMLVVSSTSTSSHYLYTNNYYGGTGVNAYIVTANYNTGSGEVAIGSPLGNANSWLYLRTVRYGDNFSFYRSTNGTSWTLHGSYNYTGIGSTVYVGIAVQAYNTSGTYVAKVTPFKYGSFATTTNILADSFSGTNGGSLSNLWSVQSGTINIQSNKAQVAAGGDSVVVSANDITYEDGLSFQLDFGSQSASDTVGYFELGFQDSAYVGQVKNTVKILYNNGTVSLYQIDSSGTGSSAGTFANLSATLPRTIKFIWYSPNKVTAVVDGVKYNPIITSVSLPNTLRAWFELYGVGDSNYINVDNASVDKNTANFWPKYARNPLYGGTQAWEGGNVEDGHVVVVGSTVYRFYVGGSNPGAGSDLQIGYMTCALADFPYGPWTKYASNPVITTYGSIIAIAAPKVILMQDNSWRMYVHQYDGTYDRMYYYTASSSDFPNTWAIANSGNPVFSENAGQWDGAQIQSHAVIPPWDSGDTNWHMYYGGQNDVSRPTGIWQLGHATSSDGLTWSRDGANPIMSPNHIGFEAYEVVPLGYFKDNNGMHILYQGFDGAYWRLGYADITVGNYSSLVRSTHNPVVTESMAGNWDSSGPEGCDVTYNTLTGNIYAFFLGSSVPNAMQGGDAYSAGLAQASFPPILTSLSRRGFTMRVGARF